MMGPAAVTLAPALVMADTEGKWWTAMDCVHDIRVLEGSLAALGPFPHFPQNERQYQLEGFYFSKGAPPVRTSIYLTDELLTKGLLFLGSAGCGKTNSMLRLSGQILDQMGPDDAAIFFDVKRDYYDAFYEEGDYVLNAVDGPNVWNIFEDLLAYRDNENMLEMKIREACCYLFYGRSSSNEPYFVNAAREITGHILRYFIYRAEETGDDGQLNHEALKNFIVGASAKPGEDGYDVYRRVMGMYRQFRGTLTYLPPKEFNDRSAYAVISEISNMANDMLAGTFGQSTREKDRYLSASNFIKKRGARALFMEFNPSLAESQSYVFRYFVDWAIAACGDPALRLGKIYLFLDELAVLPKLEYLDRALNLLRSKNVCIIAGLQNVQQMFLTYGREKGLTVLDGFQSIAAFHCGSASGDYLQRRLGSALIQRGFTVAGGKWTYGEPQIVPAVTEYEIQELRKGDAIVKLAEHGPFRFHFARYAFQREQR